jgi:serralysin
VFAGGAIGVGGSAQQVALETPFRSFYAYDASFAGGVTVAVGDVTGAGHTDIITGAGPGGGPHVKAFDALMETEVASFYAYDAGFHGGVTVATAFADADAILDIVTGPGPGLSPLVRAFKTAGPTLVSSVLPFDATFLGGVFVGSVAPPVTPLPVMPL